MADVVVIWEWEDPSGLFGAGLRLRDGRLELDTWDQGEGAGVDLPDEAAQELTNQLESWRAGWFRKDATGS